jgi:hypothetical protein
VVVIAGHCLSLELLHLLVLAHEASFTRHLQCVTAAELGCCCGASLHEVAVVAGHAAGDVPLLTGLLLLGTRSAVNE